MARIASQSADGWAGNRRRNDTGRADAESRRHQFVLFGALACHGFGKFDHHRPRHREIVQRDHEGREFRRSEAANLGVEEILGSSCSAIVDGRCFRRDQRAAVAQMNRADESGRARAADARHRASATARERSGNR